MTHTVRRGCTTPVRSIGRTFCLRLIVAVEPKGGRRTVMVTDHRAKTDFVAFVRSLLEQVYATARRIHLVVDYVAGNIIIQSHLSSYTANCGGYRQFALIG